jgi:hypothetical protein
MKASYTETDLVIVEDFISRGMWDALLKACHACSVCLWAQYARRPLQKPVCRNAFAVT